MKHRWVTIQERAEMRRLRSLPIPWSCKAIGDLLGWSKEVVRSHVKDIPPPVGGWRHVCAKTTPEQRQEMRRLRSLPEPWSLPQIGDLFEISERAVWHHVRDIPPPPQGWSAGPKVIHDPVKITRLREYGLTYTDLAERFGTTPASLMVTMCRHRKRARLLQDAARCVEVPHAVPPRRREQPTTGADACASSES